MLISVFEFASFCVQHVAACEDTVSYRISAHRTKFVASAAAAATAGAVAAQATVNVPCAVCTMLDGMRRAHTCGASLRICCRRLWIVQDKRCAHTDFHHIRRLAVSLKGYNIQQVPATRIKRIITYFGHFLSVLVCVRVVLSSQIRILFSFIFFFSFFRWNLILIFFFLNKNRLCFERRGKK